MSGKKYYPNNWEEYATAPAEYFDTCSFEEFMSWKVANWELPSSVDCVIRVTDKSSGKVTEHVYQRSSAAENKVRNLLKQPGIEFVVCTHEAIHAVAMDDLNDD